MAVDPTRLYTALLNTGLQQKDNPLYQVIHDLIRNLALISAQLAASTTPSSGTTNITHIIQQVVDLSENIESDAIMASESGTGGGESSHGYWTLLTDGEPIETDFIFANGDPISVFVPLP